MCVVRMIMICNVHLTEQCMCHKEMHIWDATIWWARAHQSSVQNWPYTVYMCTHWVKTHTVTLDKHNRAIWTQGSCITTTCYCHCIYLFSLPCKPCPQAIFTWDCGLHNHMELVPMQWNHCSPNSMWSHDIMDCITTWEWVDTVKPHNSLQVGSQSVAQNVRFSQLNCLFYINTICIFL